MKKYRIGFSLKGLMAFLMIMVPNIIWMISPPANDILSTNSSDVMAVNIVMSVSQGIMIALLILLRHTTSDPKSTDKVYVFACASCLVIYYVSWIFYYAGVVSPLMLLGMAVFPCCYFILYIVWNKIYITLIPAILFSVLHIGVTFTNFILTK